MNDKFEKEIISIYENIGSKITADDYINLSCVIYRHIDEEQQYVYKSIRDAIVIDPMLGCPRKTHEFVLDKMRKIIDNKLKENNARK